MRLNDMIAALDHLGMNLYDLAVYTENGWFTHKFQPCGMCHNCYSVAKAFISTALGLLWDEGRVSLTDPVCKYFADEMRAARDPGWRLVNVDHVISHRIGFAKGFLDIDTDDVLAYPTDDYLSIIFSHPLAYVPGTHEQYSDAAYYLLSRLIEKLAGESVDRYLRGRLFNAMHFGEIAWSRCPREHPIGATGLYMSALDMLRLGVLYLNGGVYDGRRFLSDEWVETALAREYEFHVLTPGGLYVKGGMYGQVLAFSREKRFAVALHAHEQSDYGRRLIDTLDEFEP